MSKLKRHIMNLKTSSKKVTVNKVTKDIKGNQKNYSVTKKSGIEIDVERTWDKLKIKSKMIELNQLELTPQM